MKRTLNIKLKSKTIVNVGKFSSEEDTKSKEMEEILSQALENIEESIKLIPELPIKEYSDKGKGRIPNFKAGTSLIPTEVEQKTESLDVQILKHSSEHQKDPMDENLNNQHLDCSEDMLQAEEKYEIINL